jgi:hypothetical protein
VVCAEVMTVTLGKLRSLFCSTASARSLLVELEQRDVATMPARSIAASTPELPPPITATRLPLNSGPSQCGQKQTPLALYSGSPGTFISRQRAPVARTTDSLFRWRRWRAPPRPGHRTGRDQGLRALQVHDVDVVILDVLLQRGDQLRAFGVADRDEVLDAQRVQHLAAEALGDDAGADALARGVDRRRRAGRAAADHEHVEGVFRELLRPRAPRRRYRPWRGSPQVMRPWPKGSPFRTRSARP